MRLCSIDFTQIQSVLILNSSDNGQCVTIIFLNSCCFCFFVCLLIYFFFLKGCVLSKSLPHELMIVKVSTAGKPRYGVYCGQLHIKKGMRFGPYTGSIVCPQTMAIGSVQREFLWEVKHLRLLSRLFNCRFRVKHLSLGGNLLYSY